VRLLRSLLHRLLGGFLDNFLRLLRDVLGLFDTLLRSRFASARLFGCALFRRFFLRILFAWRRHHNFLHRSNGFAGNDLTVLSTNFLATASTAWLPQAGQTPRKPAVFAPDCR